MLNLNKFIYIKINFSEYAPLPSYSITINVYLILREVYGFYDNGNALFLIRSMFENLGQSFPQLILEKPSNKYTEIH